MHPQNALFNMSTACRKNRKLQQDSKGTLKLPLFSHFFKGCIAFSGLHFARSFYVVSFYNIKCGSKTSLMQTQVYTRTQTVRLSEQTDAPPARGSPSANRPNTASHCRTFRHRPHLAPDSLALTGSISTSRETASNALKTALSDRCQTAASQRIQHPTSSPETRRPCAAGQSRHKPPQCLRLTQAAR